MDLANLVLKTDLHIHTKEDPLDSKVIEYSAFELVEHLFSKGFDVFSITLHDYMFEKDYMKKVQDYAKSKGLLYISRSIEKTIEEDHILIYGMDKHDAESINTYPELRQKIIKYTIEGRRGPLLVGGAHPDFPSKTAIKDHIETCHDLIDFLEYNAFYISGINFNNGGLDMASKYKKVMVGNSDAHDLEVIGKTYTEISVPPNAFCSINRHFLPGNREEFKSMLKRCHDQDYEKAKNIIISCIKNGTKESLKIVTGPLSPIYVLGRLTEF